MKIRNFIILGLLLVIGYLVVTDIPFFGNPKQPKTIIKRDTVEVETIEYDTIPSDPTELDTVFVKDTIYTPIPSRKIGDSINVYTGIHEVDSVSSIKYEASVTGRLNWINFGVIRSMPTVLKTVTRDREIIKEITIQPDGFYAGIDLMMNREPAIGLGVMYIKGTNSFSFTYGTDNSVRVGYKRKIF